RTGSAFATNPMDFPTGLVFSRLSLLLVHAGRRGFCRRLSCSRLRNNRLAQGRGGHLRLVVDVGVFSLDRFAVERVDQLTLACLPDGRTIANSIVALRKCRCRQKGYCEG